LQNTTGWLLSKYGSCTIQILEGINIFSHGGKANEIAHKYSLLLPSFNFFSPLIPKIKLVNGIDVRAFFNLTLIMQGKDWEKYKYRGT
jgi:hypothetical protein